MLVGAAVLATFTTAYFGYLSFQSSESLVKLEKRHLEIKTMQWQILHLDEILTMSARMGAATGKVEWEERYNLHDPILDRTIKKLFEIVPDITSKKSTAKTDEANQKLVAMERRSFALSRQGRGAEAKQLLFGSEYLRQKGIYAIGMQELNEEIDAQLEQEQKSYARKTRRLFYVSIFLFTTSILGWVIVFTLFHRWNSEIHALNAGLRIERDIAEKANQAKSLFLANISHELRTPMHGILSFARFGQQKFEHAPKEKLKSYFDEIYGSGSQLMKLLNDLLDLSKLEAGKVDYAMAEGNLLDTVEAVATELRAFVAEKGLRLEIHQEITDGRAQFDRKKIMQVMRNLLANAVKFANPGSPIDIFVDKTAGKLICRVVNRGIGIPGAELETIFDKFVQSSKTRTGAGGTGLGLAICKEIIEQHGGRIWAECDAQGETKFTFELPESPAKARSQAS